MDSIQLGSFRETGPRHTPPGRAAGRIATCRGLSLLLAIAALGFATSSVRALTAPTCSTDTTLCIGGRFQVVASWTAANGSSGSGHAVSLTPDSGYFWFFDPMNLEVVVKVLDGCSINGRFWVFSAGLTDLAVDIDVTDPVTHSTKRYSNSQGAVFLPASDTAAFTGCSGSAEFVPPLPVRIASSARPESSNSRLKAEAEPVCWTNDAVLCTSGRFEIQATWNTPSGETGSGHAVQITDESGYFWFFDPANVELITKTLDACAIGSEQWFFAAGMTNVDVVIDVTDTYTGEFKSYENSTGNTFPTRIDTSAFTFCPPAGSQVVTLGCKDIGVASCPRAALREVNELNACYASPESFSVHVSDSVIWAWGPGEQHQIATSDGWNSGELTGPVMVSHTFAATGNYSWDCQIGFTPEARVYACGDRDCCEPVFEHEGGQITVVP